MTDAYIPQDLERLMDEIFYQEERSSAELRLTVEEIRQLAYFSQICYEPMDNHIDPDGKRWYLVRLIE
ncbi:hypothetical protein [uncultured Flavonifractor sp.]|mgnify:CR=1 FL=1|uniref:hypothetical protein n=1 Tax=uncultured Flavonifractor sp. TaxID=1193534 RepID=UPI0026208AE4|nr:hypothetical protein [uncultured Flavonifractor sp.]